MRIRNTPAHLDKDAGARYAPAHLNKDAGAIPSSTTRTRMQSRDRSNSPGLPSAIQWQGRVVHLVFFQEYAIEKRLS